MSAVVARDRRRSQISEQGDDAPLCVGKRSERNGVSVHSYAAIIAPPARSSGYIFPHAAVALPVVRSEGSAWNTTRRLPVWG
ncbi:hypothetical protein EYF80_024771 [Liparis tanakae]|uniref:Uncharacterized protein n=1 Tax=Liparis tanakae TaxID=230148 RepID=A0A4Z2HJI8_9TELE|nr:hypothetical protein EYF80_024771 [Liparis tanakae]